MRRKAKREFYWAGSQEKNLIRKVKQTSIGNEETNAVRKVGNGKRIRLGRRNRKRIQFYKKSSIWYGKERRLLNWKKS